MTTSHTAPSPPPASGGAIDRLIEAERRWRAKLDEARAEAERIVAEARAAADAEESATRAALDEVVRNRREELQRTLDRERASIDESARREAATYGDLDEGTVRRLATDIARGAPWLAGATSAVRRP